MKIQEHRRKIRVKQDRAAQEEMVKKARKDYEKPCKGMFEFVDAQGGWLEFSNRMFPGDPITTFKISHGEIVELPMGLVKRLNNTRKKVRKPRIDAEGKVAEYSYISRIRFTPMDVL